MQEGLTKWVHPECTKDPTNLKKKKTTKTDGKNGKGNIYILC